VPTAFRQICAIALYTGLRPGELEALTWADVDLDARTLSVSKAVDSHDGTVKAPKTQQGLRTIPMREHLAPLLDALKGKPTKGVVASLGGFAPHMAIRFRQQLVRATVTRPRLTAPPRSRSTSAPVATPVTSLALWHLSAQSPRDARHARVPPRHTPAPPIPRSAAVCVETKRGVGADEEPYSRTVTTPDARPAPVSAQNAALLAPTVGLEPTTRRLTAACSTN
jgi:hypothetical protein